MKSNFGAPLTNEEINIIEEYLPEISEFLDENSLNEIKYNGFWEEKEKELMTRSIEDEDCVFVYYENDIAKCAIERAYNEIKIGFIKPISCHMFPIRVSDFGGDVLRYEKYADCKPALKKGEETDLSVLEFCEISIKRKYNSSFYNKLVKLNGK
jgi:hypothetical protein